MVVIVPSGQTTQLVGMAPLPEESYKNLKEASRLVYADYQRMAQELADEKKNSARSK